jgi:hypothetical protein
MDSKCIDGEKGIIVFKVPEYFRSKGQINNKVIKAQAHHHKRNQVHKVCL